MSKGKNFMETLVKENSFKYLFGVKKDQGRQEKLLECFPSGSKKLIKELSPLSNVVVARCSRILLLSCEELQQHFEDEVSDSAKHPSKYARNFLEYCCFRALAVATQISDYLSDKDFRRLTFDMMLAWEDSGAVEKPAAKKFQAERGSGQSEGVEEEEEDPAMFFTDLMPLLVDVERTVGKHSFVRLGPAVSGVADITSVHSQFDALTSSTGGRLPFPVYDKYLVELDKVIKIMKNQATSSQFTNLRLSKGENVIEVEGTVATQPVLQHVGTSTWPGRVSLTDRALYFESLGVVSFDKPKKFDLATDLGQVIKPELTGPWGTRLFDRAILFKSTANPEPVVLEFPELTGHTRRDYWLAIIREIISVHQFIRKFQVGDAGQAEVLSRAVLGMARLRATKETHHASIQRPEAVLTFSIAAELPGGDLILEALAEKLLGTTLGVSSEIYERSHLYARSAVATLATLGFTSGKGTGNADDAALPVGEFLVGDLTPLEKVVMQSQNNSKKVELAKATIDGVKVDGIGTNLAVMKELLEPVNATISWITVLQSWDEPFKTSTFIIICSYIIMKNLIGYIMPICLLCLAVFMIWFRQGGEGSTVGEVKVVSPPSQNTVEQLMALQQGLSQLEELIQAGNVILLKIRALLFSTLPQLPCRQQIKLS